MTALLQHSLHSPCAVARQDAAPPEGGLSFLHGRRLASGGAASSRAWLEEGRNLPPRRRRQSMAIDGNRRQLMVSIESMGRAMKAGIA